MRIDGSGTLRASCVLCPNPGPMTLDGTNTWVLREPGARSVVVVDPGPHHERHLERVARMVQEQGAQVTQTLLTHRHPDHSEGARYFSELTGSPVRAADPGQRIGGDGFAEGESVEADGLALRVLRTPGHTTDSVSFHLPADDVILTGDTVLGRGTAVITGDGDLGDYLDSLARLRDLAAATDARALLPGHGPICTEPLVKLNYYIRHREDRLGEVLGAVDAGDDSVDAVLARVYADVDGPLRAAAAESVRAQLRYLIKRGDVPPELLPE
ncbi:MBL fold metallo-hydrolase [Actinorugispora endophytica]|uniref:Glyoxylase-like metal-dependent hydrolase (Beta-lactamase superfamily II) n=1 Tax=Actinorugispora endophytica TaxID=1605990 RepID=A0A4R6VE95_9ACTN|nr:MBL fold metallo-hydrolase [Actinorugispora endophytica]TDQ55367.1 glyoxylase-like metal-dependent hydrolase (beta-lactamase superfamily II) [Actinorugispora endophytica]